MDANRQHPSKEEVRAWMARRRISSRAGLPLPSPDEIRRELGWHQLGWHQVGRQQPPVVRQESAALLMPFVLAELAALTAVTWYWLLLRLARECPRPSA
ncbi:hypothetical protein OU994_08425 [Pseudoduganella sp. SL102]|uniref:hypothetical protein n=1 Tax=Pseudoduganella sp. SL102 TaxID=2995154 RepID=UPI00248BA189|nr:hypothetical protein [Pseudoduganella sp. SL102]WBS04288.1 hypothetical protein OU994_08425 [Pseudoduganella sp. SL102]